MRTVGGQSEVGRIRRVLLKHPREAFVDRGRIEAQWRRLGYTGPPDLERAADEYERFAAQLRNRGIEVVLLPRDDATGLDSIYARDAAVVSNRGMILCSMGKPARCGEPAAMERFLTEAGIPVLGRIGGGGTEDGALLEGGDVIWLDEHTLAVGQGYRTNAAGLHRLRVLLGAEVEEVLPVPLPHWNGPGDVLHLMSLVSPIDRDVALVHSRLLPAPFRQWLVRRGVTLLEVPVEEYAGMACNVLALAPRACLMLAGNPKTRRLLESAGVEVWTYSGAEISLKGAGGPTCLTRPLLRE